MISFGISLPFCTYLVFVRFVQSIAIGIVPLFLFHDGVDGLIVQLKMCPPDGTVTGVIRVASFTLINSVASGIDLAHCIFVMFDFGIFFGEENAADDEEDDDASSEEHCQQKRRYGFTREDFLLSIH